MSLFIELHLIQNFAPSNLNRDDTGAPKDALFGGHRRARISSQCLKRAIRNSPEMKKIPPQCNSIRTQNIVSLIEEKLVELGYSDSQKKIKSALSSVKLKIKENGNSETLLFLGEKEISGLAELIIKYWDQLGESDANASKKEAKNKAPKNLEKDITSLLNGQKAVDVALYGRMLADLPVANQEASCQVAHAISMQRIEREFDYFTAIDDRGNIEQSGAGMIGQIEFNSATFYRYAVLDPHKLISNLEQDKELALESIRAFILSCIKAIPTGKQNSFAAHNLPSFIGVSIRNGTPLNLANAFEKPVWPKNETALSTLSVRELANHEDQIAGIYGHPEDCWGMIDLSGAWPKEKGRAHADLNSLLTWVIEEVKAKLEK